MNNPNPRSNKDPNSYRAFALCLIGFGLMLEVLLPLSDVLRGKEFGYGKAQLVFAGSGLVLIVLGGLSLALHVNPIPQLISYFKLVGKQFLKLMGWKNDLLGRLSQRLIWPLEKSLNKFNWVDISIISVFLIFSIVYTLGRWNGISPFVYLGSDASYISSYAATLDHPDQFSNDYFLANQGNVDAYIAFHIPLLRLINQITGSYGNAFLVLLPISLFLKLLGFYLVGRKLFTSRILGAFLAILTFPIIYTGAWDYWGLIGDALPRNLYEIVFPWILYFALKWIDQPRKWMILGGLLGAVTYLHSISGGIIFAVLCLVYLVQSSQPISKRLLQLLAMAGIYLVIVSPFAYFYIKSMTAAQTVQLSYADKVAYMLSFYGENHIEALKIFKGTIQTLSYSGILPVAIVGFIVAIINQKVTFRSPLIFWLSWFFSLALVTVVFPMIELQFDSYLHLINLQMMLVRGLRYLPPLLIIFIFECFFGKTNTQKNSFMNLVEFSGIVLLLVSFVLTINYNQQDAYFHKEINCLSQGKIACPTQQEKDGLEVIQALDEITTSKDTVLSIPPLNTPFALAIRYTALRPMGYNMTDVRRLNTDVYTQKNINTAMNPWNKLEHADAETVLISYLTLAKDMKAKYLIVQKSDFLPDALENLSPVFENVSYLLVKVPN